jgi:DNA-directed RNA polymerase I, II, and III subunit RPABC2
MSELEKNDKLIPEESSDEESDNDEDSNDDISIDDDNDSFDDEGDKTEKIFKNKEKQNKHEEEEEEDVYENETEIEKDDEEEGEDTFDENYLQKIDKNLKSKIISDFHPELKVHSYEEILSLTTIVRDEAGNIIDPLHKTLSVLTKYEYSRVLGERAKQLSIGADPLVKLNDYIIDEYSIALLELKEKKIPFIIERPLPNSSSEYWKLEDLEILM